MIDGPWYGRISEFDTLTSFLEGPAPALARIRGGPGSGRTALVRRAAAGVRALWLTGAEVPPSIHLRSFERALETVGVPLEDAEPAGDRWSAVAGAVAEALDRERAPLLLVLDDADRLPRPLLDAVGSALWTRARARGLPLRIVVVSGLSSSPLLTDPAPRPELDLTLEELTFREVAEHLPESWPPREKLLAWAAFGGRPDHLRYLEGGRRASWAIGRAVLDPEGALHRMGLTRLERAVQKPERYAGILTALADGADDWAGIRHRVPELEDGRGLAPYVQSLEEHGLVRVERSLDARPGGRNRRYRLADLFMGFWFGSVLPALPLLSVHPPADAWRHAILPGLAGHLERAFERACREVLADPPPGLLPAAAREVGALWGEGYDLPAAGTLRTGAVVLGRCVWGRMATLEDAAVLREARRATSYGFGREARMRVVFAGDAVDVPLARRAAREDLLHVVRLEDLVV